MTTVTFQIQIDPESLNMYPYGDTFPDPKEYPKLYDMMTEFVHQLESLSGMYIGEEPYFGL
jgi:hypothetical protein